MFKKNESPPGSQEFLPLGDSDKPKAPPATGETLSTVGKITPRPIVAEMEESYLSDTR